jgi:hypothetical protein
LISKLTGDGWAFPCCAWPCYAGVSRWRLWESENGTTKLTVEEQARLRAALREEATRLRGVLAGIDIEDSPAA